MGGAVVLLLPGFLTMFAEILLPGARGACLRRLENGLGERQANVFAPARQLRPTLLEGLAQLG